MDVKKRPEADNERLRIPLVFLGFFIIASLVTLSFSFKVPVDFADLNRDEQAKDDIPEELEIIEEEEEEEEEEIIEQEIEELDDTPDLEDEIETVENIDEDEVIQIEIEDIDDPEPEPEPEAPIVDYPDKEAVFPGGAAAMKKFLADNISYPEMAMELGDQGRVFVEFVVNQDGSIEQVKILRGVSKEIDKEARRVVHSMPRWKPAESGGEPVRARCRIPINFILQ